MRIGTSAEGFTPDEHARSGVSPGLRNASGVPGFSGHGITFAPVLTEIADLARGGSTEHDLTHLDPGRCFSA